MALIVPDSGLPAFLAMSLVTINSMSRLLPIMVCATLAMHVRADDPVDFNRDIRPILSNHCFQCHGPDEDKREADLRLDVRDGAIADLGGYAAIVPNRADESELIGRVMSADDDLRMPPPQLGEPLSAEQIALLTRWISQGASYATHWSFEPIKRVQIPKVQAHGHWEVNPIDAFIYQQLAEQGIKPSAEASPSTLIRRVYLDLLGIPPTLEQVDAFVNDRHPGAFGRMLDRALSSQGFGERWGRHWLDQARYADSHGYTNDNERSIWPYRDWVIEAFNRDLPFDRFTIEQLAGDLLDDASLDQRVATGFHRNTLINSEGGTKADQFRDEQVKDRLDTTGLVWMGLTVGCAKCHAHKFDPISQAEYYRLYAFFNSTADSNSVTPTVSVPSVEQIEELRLLRNRQAELRQHIDADAHRAVRQAAWEVEVLAQQQGTNEATDQADSIDWTVLDLSGRSDQQSKFTSLPDKSLVVSGQGTNEEEYLSTTLSPPTKVRSVRLEVLTDDSLPGKGPGRADNGNFVLSEFWFRTGDGRELRFKKAAAQHSQEGYEVAKAIDGKTDTGWAINGAPEGSLNRNRTAWFVLPDTLEVGQDTLTFLMQFHVNKNYGIGRYRISVSSEEWIDRPNLSLIATLLRVDKDQRSRDQQGKIDRAFIQSDDALRPIDAELQSVTKRIEMIQRQIPTTMVLKELDEPRQAYVQVRGDFLRRGANVDPGVPAILSPIDRESTADRLDFAKWLVRPDHPLTARVRVNRIWMRLFGRGLVETENDFGIQGTLPTHPELLDWLASEFMRSGWSTKNLLRLIMSSATYRQSSQAREDLRSIDPRNLLLARQSRLRVEAEIVRDLALAVSGKLSEKIGGPSVYPPQPEGVYAFTQRAKNWQTSQGEDRYRRGMYTFFYRSAPYPMLSTFDVPKFNTVCTCRDRSNTPLQSLTLSNSESLLELAGHLGKRIIAEVPNGNDEQRIQHAYRICYSRLPVEGEIARLVEYVQRCRDHFDNDEKAWAAVARVLMNLDEFVTRE